MNILNEKIYIVLWFWFIILAIITAVNLVIRAIQLFCPNTRQRCTSKYNLVSVWKLNPFLPTGSSSWRREVTWVAT